MQSVMNHLVVIASLTESTANGTLRTDQGTELESQVYARRPRVRGEVIYSELAALLPASLNIPQHSLSSKPACL